MCQETCRLQALRPACARVENKRKTGREDGTKGGKKGGTNGVVGKGVLINNSSLMHSNCCLLKKRDLIQ